MGHREIRGGVRVFGAMMLSAWVGSAHADQTCTPTGDNGGQQCIAGIRSDTVQATVAAAGGQRMSQWCWAASISMVFRYYGFEVSQERIVAETFGQVVNMPGTTEQILTTLSREWTDDHGRHFQVSAGLLSAEGAAAELAADRPLMVGTLGHAMVLTALGYVKDPWYGDRVTSAVVRDPWPGRGRRELAPEEWNMANMLLGIRVAGQAARAEKRQVEPLPKATYVWDDGISSVDPGEQWSPERDVLRDDGFAENAAPVPAPEGDAPEGWDEGANEPDWNALLLFLSRL